MYNTSPPQQQEKKPGKKCNDADSQTKKTIKNSKNAYCGNLKLKLGILQQCEETYRGKRTEYEHKKCRLVSTEKNYRIFRNAELTVGLQLMRASGNIETNITSYVAFDTKLSTALSDLLANVKTTKTKFADLRDAACKLDACCKDSCNRTQWAIITGEKFEDCGEEKQKPEHEHQHGKRPHDCEDVVAIIHELIHEPGSLSKEIDIILNSTADVLGIQTFSNISSLSQQFLPIIKANAKSFDDWLVDRMTKGGTDLATAQANLSQVIKDLADAEFTKFNARLDLDAYKGVKDFLCNHKCECVTEGEGRLDKCKCDICEICHQVTKIYSVETEEKQPTPSEQLD
jgi:hypothetical protein